jgi:hypothetical protein
LVRKSSMPLLLFLPTLMMPRDQPPRMQESLQVSMSSESSMSLPQPLSPTVLIESQENKTSSSSISEVVLSMFRY